jgi:hypothetical protein
MKLIPSKSTSDAKDAQEMHMRRMEETPAGGRRSCRITDGFVRRGEEFVGLIEIQKWDLVQRSS